MSQLDTSPQAPFAQEPSGQMMPALFLEASPDPRLAYAKAVQKSAYSEIQSLRSRKELRSTEWAASLEAAPAAVCIMAILLKTASKKEAAGLEVKTRDITANGEVIGELKSVPAFQLSSIDLWS